MEVSLSSNHYTLSLASRSSSAFSLSNLRSIRTRFLGCSHNLRPPGGIRSSRNKCKKLQLLHLHSPRFIFKASLSSHSIIVVVTLVTLSVVSLFYFSKRKKNSKEVTGLTVILDLFSPNLLLHWIWVHGSCLEVCCTCKLQLVLTFAD